MKLEVKQNCPLNDFNPCKQFDCSWFMKIAGTNPNDGQPTEDGVALWRGCRFFLLRMLNSLVKRDGGRVV